MRVSTQYGREIKTKPVYAHMVGKIAEAVDDQPSYNGMIDVERIAAAGVVDIA